MRFVTKKEVVNLTLPKREKRETLCQVMVMRWKFMH